MDYKELSRIVDSSEGLSKFINEVASKCEESSLNYVADITGKDWTSRLLTTKLGISDRICIVGDSNGRKKCVILVGFEDLSQYKQWLAENGIESQLDGDVLTATEDLVSPKASYGAVVLCPDLEPSNISSLKVKGISAYVGHSIDWDSVVGGYGETQCKNLKINLGGVSDEQAKFVALKFKRTFGIKGYVGNEVEGNDIRLSFRQGSYNINEGDGVPGTPFKVVELSYDDGRDMEYVLISKN